MNDIHEFFWDSDSENEPFYLVNNREETYILIDNKSPYYEFCKHMYCGRWYMAKDRITANYKLVDTLQKLNDSSLA